MPDNPSDPPKKAQPPLPSSTGPARTPTTKLPPPSVGTTGKVVVMLSSTARMTPPPKVAPPLTPTTSSTLGKPAPALPLKKVMPVATPLPAEQRLTSTTFVKLPPKTAAPAFVSLVPKPKISPVQPEASKVAPPLLPPKRIEPDKTPEPPKSDLRKTGPIALRPPEGTPAPGKADNKKTGLIKLNTPSLVPVPAAKPNDSIFDEIPEPAAPPMPEGWNKLQTGELPLPACGLKDAFAAKAPEGHKPPPLPTAPPLAAEPVTPEKSEPVLESVPVALPSAHQIHLAPPLVEKGHDKAHDEPGEKLPAPHLPSADLKMPVVGAIPQAPEMPKAPEFKKDPVAEAAKPLPPAKPKEETKSEQKAAAPYMLTSTARIPIPGAGEGKPAPRPAVLPSRAIKSLAESPVLNPQAAAQSAPSADKAATPPPVPSLDKQAEITAKAADPAVSRDLRARGEEDIRKPGAGPITDTPQAKAPESRPPPKVEPLPGEDDELTQADATSVVARDLRARGEGDNRTPEAGPTSKEPERKTPPKVEPLPGEDDELTKTAKTSGKETTPSTIPAVVGTVAAATGAAAVAAEIAAKKKEKTVTLPPTRAERAKKRKMRGVIIFWILVPIVAGLLYAGIMYFGRDTRIEGQVIPPAGMTLADEVWIVSDFSEFASGVADDDAKERVPLQLAVQEAQDHVQRVQADISAREERIHLIQDDIQAAKDDVTNLVKKSQTDSQSIYDNQGKELDGEYNAHMNALKDAIAGRAASLKLQYQPDPAYPSPEVWANAYRLALYQTPAGVDGVKEHQWIADQMKQWRDFEKSMDDRYQQMREQAANAKVESAPKITEINTKIEDLNGRIQTTQSEEDPLKAELKQAQDDLAQAQAADAGLDDKFYGELYRLPGDNISYHIPLKPDGRFTWLPDNPFGEGETRHIYWMFSRVVRADGRQYWALQQVTMEKNKTTEVIIPPASYESTKQILRPNLTPDEIEQ